MAPSKSGPKVMSNRLAGMKFMQRTGAAPSTPSQPPAKKQRLSNGSALGSPATPNEQDSSAQQGETKWYLSFKAPEAPVAQSPLRIVSAGYSSLDATGRAGEDEDEEPAPRAIPGRKSFGKFNRKIEKAQNPDLSSSSDSESGDEGEDEGSEDGEVEDDPTGVKALIAQGRKEAADRARAERKAKKKEKEADSKKLAEERRKKEIDLNRVTGISGGGGSSGSAANIECYYCKKKGHRKQDCPKLQAQQGRRY